MTEFIVNSKNHINPFVSVIIPVRNEAGHINEVLNAVLIQDYGVSHMEIIVADGISADNTREIIQDFIGRHQQMQIHVLNNPGRIVPTGINIAFGYSNGDIIIRVDGHTIIAPDYVRQCVEALQLAHADNVGGKMNAIGSTFFGKAVALATSTPFGIGGGRFHYSDDEEWVDTVYMGAWPRRVFDEIGLFDEELVRNQDDEFNYRLRAAGGKILLSPKIKSEYTVRSAPGALWRQYFQYGYWKVRVLQKHPLQMGPRQFVPPLFVLALLASLGVALSANFHLLAPIIPLLYGAANLFASLWTASQRGWKYLWLLPVVFAILHLSYGTGFLVGLVKFWNRWGDNKGGVPMWTGEPVE